MHSIFSLFLNNILTFLGEKMFVLKWIQTL